MCLLLHVRLFILLPPNHIMQKLVDGEQSVKRGRQLARRVLTQQRIAHKVETGAN